MSVKVSLEPTSIASQIHPMKRSLVVRLTTTNEEPGTTSESRQKQRGWDTAQGAQAYKLRTLDAFKVSERGN